jgi:TonB family protein
MHEGVSDILVARARELDGVSRPVSWSFAVHVGILLTVAVLPSAWFAGKTPDKPMIISLGAGAVGPNPSGLTALGGKKVEEVAPPTKRPEPIVPTAPKSTAMVEPLKAPVKPPPPTKKTTAAATQAPPATKLATGAQITQGNAVAATTATGLGVGLSTGGQGGSALDSNWCCPDWTNFLLTHVYWTEHLGAVGTVVIQFVVLRDGSVTDVQVKTKSGNFMLDTDAQRAVLTAKLLPLPAAYEPNRLTITLTFPYSR